MRHTLHGQCHCGNISVSFTPKKAVTEIAPRECSCGLCTKHKASWISDPEGIAEVIIKEPAQVSHYRFGTKTSDFILCRECGVLVIATCEIEGRKLAVINIRTMPEGSFTASPVTTDFDDEDVTKRLARRAKSWTGNVVIKYAGK